MLSVWIVYDWTVWTYFPPPIIRDRHVGHACVPLKAPKEMKGHQPIFLFFKTGKNVHGGGMGKGFPCYKIVPGTMMTATVSCLLTCLCLLNCLSKISTCHQSRVKNRWFNHNIWLLLPCIHISGKMAVVLLSTKNSGNTQWFVDIF